MSLADAPENVEVVCGQVAKKTVKDAKKLRPKIKNPFKTRSKGGESIDAIAEAGASSVYSIFSFHVLSIKTRLF